MKKSKKHSTENGTKDYIIKTFCYLVILLAITIITAFAAITPVANLVHKVEEYVAMSVRDIRLNDDAYQPLTLENSDGVHYEYGDKIAAVTSENFGLNCPVYYGSNRVSMSTGAGLSGDSAIFSADGTSIVCGYTESSLSALDYAEIGDVITVTTNYGEFSYEVFDIKYIDENEMVSRDFDKGVLIIKGLTSDFSDHGSESLYVFAEITDGGGD